MLRPQRGCRHSCLLPLTCAWDWLCSSKDQSTCESRFDLRGWIQRSTSYPISPQTDVGTRIGGRDQFPPSLPFSFQPSVLPSPIWGPFSAIDAAQECPGAKEGDTRRPAPPASSQPWGPSACLRRRLRKGHHVPLGVPGPASLWDPGLASVFPSCLQPSFVLVTHTCMCRSLH